MTTPKILIVESDASAPPEIHRVILGLGYRVEACTDGDQAVQAAGQSCPDLFVLCQADSAQTLVLAERLRSAFKRPLLLIAEQIVPALVERYKALAPEGFLQKPVDDLSLEIAVELALKRSRSERQLLATLASLSESEARFRGLFAAAADGVVISDQSGTILMANPRIEAMLGYDAGELCGQSIDVMLPEHLRAMHQHVRANYVPSAGPRPMGRGLNIVARRKDGTEFPADVSLSVLRTARGLLVTGMVQDISARVQAQEELKRVNRMLRVLSAGNEALVRADSECSLLDAVCRAIVEVGGYPLAWVAYASTEVPGTLRLVARAGVPDDVEGRRADVESRTCRIAQVLASGAPMIVRACEAQAQSRDEGCLHGLAAKVGLPLTLGARTIGVLGIFSRQEGAFNADEMKLLAELASDLSFGIAGQRSEVLRRQSESRLRLFEQAIESSGNGIMISDSRLPDKPIMYVNPAFERITGYGAAGVLGRNARFLLGEDRDQLALTELRLALRQARAVRVELRNYRPDGRAFWNELSVAPVCEADGSVSHFVGVINDISERKRHEEQLERQATHDALTGLANRSLLFDRLSHAMSYATRSERNVAVLLLDLDRFKDINDSFGHRAGDQVLLQASARIQSCVRDSDTVARLGGDEFVVLLTDMAQAEDVAALARNILQQLAQPLTLPTGVEVFPDASVGIALYPGDGASAEVLLKNADAAMYRAKEQGGGSASFYAPEMEARSNRRLTLEAQMRRALERHEFVLHYQPQMNLGSGRMSGAEALLRWQTAEGESISPVEFIPVAEQSGLILPIGRWVIASVAQQQRRWLDQGLPVVPVAVNLSPRQFRESGLLAGIVAELAAVRLEHRWLELEITESLMLENVAQVLETLNAMKHIGLQVALDDFGTGYSSLSYLRRLPVDTLKIDRAFVMEVDSNPDDAAIIRAIIAMAHSLGLKVVAEGVETQAQLDYLRTHRCDSMQGYFFSRPVPADAFAELLRSGRQLPDSAADWVV